MLTPEQAKAELETHRDRADERRRLVAIAALDEPARAIAYALLGREADGTEARRVVHADYVMHASMARQEWAAPRLDALTPEARLPILRAFFPVEAEAVERGLLPGGGRGGGARLAAPAHPALCRLVRAGVAVSRAPAT